MGVQCLGQGLDAGLIRGGEHGNPPWYSCPENPTSGGQSIGASASASVLPMNIQDFL